uniref:Uncharacterized protein n=1 Tax=Plectus sambesii TaxID=2011161 RepID=A0A914VQ39_9BILA
MASDQRPQHALLSNAQETPQEDSRRNNDNNITNNITGGRNVIAPVSGGIVVQGDYYAPMEPLPAPAPPTPEELKEMLKK